MIIYSSFARIGMGEWSPTLPCHTTGHAGPHPAVRRVELTLSRELGKSERGKVSVGQSDFQRWRVRKVPRSIGATRRFRGVLRSDAALAELPISCGSPSPLLRLKSIRAFREIRLEHRLQYPRDRSL